MLQPEVFSSCPCNISVILASRRGTLTLPSGIRPPSCLNEQITERVLVIRQYATDSEHNIVPPADVLPSPLTAALWMVVGSRGTPLLSGSSSSAASLLNMDAAALSVSVSLHTVGPSLCSLNI